MVMVCVPLEANEEYIAVLRVGLQNVISGCKRRKAEGPNLYSLLSIHEFATLYQVSGGVLAPSDCTGFS